MGRSKSASCLKIVACGKKSPDDDDITTEIDTAAEAKTPSDKRRWSFRKRSARHRLLSNTVPSDLLPSSGYKESPECNANDFSEQTHAPVLGKLSVPRKADDVFPLSPVALCSKDAGPFDSIVSVSNGESRPSESAAIIVQASARAYLAQKEIAKLKNVIKLQAAIRGHLVRRQAVGTLRCVQAIVKMQALIRAHHVRSSAEGLAIHWKLAEMRKSASARMDNQGKGESGVEPKPVCTPADAWFRNGFACQLLKSTEKTKPICIVCDPINPSSGWCWLERWMALSAKEHPGPRAAHLLGEQQGSAEKIHLVSNEMEASDKCLRTNNFKSSVARDEEYEEATYSFGTQLEEDDDLITIDANGFNFHSGHSFEISNESNNTNIILEQPQVAAEGSDFTSSLRNALQSTLDTLSSQSGSSDYATAGYIPGAPKTEGGSQKHSLNETVFAQQATQEKKPASVPRKSCSLAFAAVQSKFEELSSPLASGTINAISDHCGGSRLGSFSPPKSDSWVMDVNQADTASCSQRFQKGTSECGTEISISSTLDSPDRFEPEGVELEHEAGNIDDGDCEEHGTFEDELESDQPISEALRTPNTVACLPKEPEGSLMGPVDPAIAATNMDSSQRVKQQIELDVREDTHAYDSSQEGSPTTRATIPESHRTPSSEVPSGPQKSKPDSKKSVLKRILSSSSKGSPSSQNQDSSERSTLECVPKEPKSGGHRNSFGSAKSDHTDCEQRNNTIPSYMQATESARAKSLARHSPKSSPDVHDVDGYLKKRHSLPVGNGKQQNSPRMQRSLSQAQPGAKRSSGHSPQEKEWRW